MQNRRQFLCTVLHTAAGATATLVLTPILGACGSSENNNTTPTPTTTTNPTTPGCDGAGATSTNTLGHTHTVCVPLADINNPPAAGNTYTTSAATFQGVAHTHQITLSQAQLTTLAKGGTVTVTTTIVESHTHDFTLLENAAPQTSPVPTTAPTPTPTPTGPY
jgi:hypothetical protein